MKRKESFALINVVGNGGIKTKLKWKIKHIIATRTINFVEPESNLKEINEKLNKIETTKNDDLKVKQTKEKVTQELAILGTFLSRFDWGA